MAKRIAESTVRRLSLYLRALNRMDAEGVETVSSEQLAQYGVTTAAHVRKDLSQFGSFGKRGLGYSVRELNAHLHRIMGMDHQWRVALVGAGRLGSALHEYPNFRDRGFEFVAVLDADPSKIGQNWGDLVVEDVEDLEDILKRRAVDVAILAVPPEAVPEVAERVAAAGVRGVLNFAPTRIRPGWDLVCRNVDPVMELESLAFLLTRASGGE